METQKRNDINKLVDLEIKKWNALINFFSKVKDGKGKTKLPKEMIKHLEMVKTLLEIGCYNDSYSLDKIKKEWFKDNR